jgi:hypothetical protein
MKLIIKKYKQLVWLVFFGSLWGVSEVLAGGALYEANVPRASLYLSVWAIFVLASARGLLNKPGSSTAIGGIAAIYRLVNTAPFFCHICGILFLGMAFDLASSLLMRNENKVSFRSSLSGVFGSYGGQALFALVMTYIIRYEFWVEGGWRKVLDHIFVSGSLIALAASVVFPLGYWVGLKGESFRPLRSRWAYRGAFLFSLALWALGRIAA